MDSVGKKKKGGGGGVEIRRKIKVGNKLLKKIIIKPGIKIVAGLFKKLLFSKKKKNDKGGGGGLTDEEPAFMSFIIKVNPNKAGWQKSIISLLQNCKGARFKMNREGIVEVSGVSDPKKLLKKIKSGGKVELHWFQFGQCCSNLFMPEQPKKEAPQQDNNNNKSPKPQQQQQQQIFMNHPYDQYHHLPPTNYLPLGEYAGGLGYPPPLHRQQVFMNNPYNATYY